MLPPIVEPLWCGVVSYRQGVALQARFKRIVGESAAKNFLLLLEHYPVYTVGIRDKRYAGEKQRLIELGAEYCTTDRGGLITFHGPGQLVAYPILNLKNFKDAGVKWYVHSLEDALVQTCSHFGVKSAASCEFPGVWVNDEKIAAIGVHVSRYVTSHGIALNCNTNLGWFKQIVPCGIEGKGVTSLSAIVGNIVTTAQVVPAFLTAFAASLNCELRPIEQFLLTNSDL